jgi:hypothetical protein
VHEQRSLAEDYGPIVAEFHDRGNGTTGLEAAISHARETNERLVIGRLGKWAWSHDTLLRLKGVEFIAADQPAINHKTLHIVLERARFFAKKGAEFARKGIRPGQPRGFARPGVPQPKKRHQKAAVAKAAELRTLKARQLYQMMPFQELRAKGLTYEQIATKLNELGHRTTIGTLFNEATVYRIMHR